MWLGEPRSTNPLRIPHPKIDKLACQAQGVGILAKGEISLHDAYCTYLILIFKIKHSYFTTDLLFCQAFIFNYFLFFPRGQIFIDVLHHLFFRKAE